MHIDNKLMRIFIFFILISTSLFAQESKRIEILNANTIGFNKKLGKDVKRLIGDVRFKHGTALMYCDSAYLNSRTNILKAFHNVHIIQNDSIDLYGDFLDYDGNTKIAKVRQNVKLIHDKSILNTDSLDYDRVTDIAHYFSWGYLKDDQNNLESVNGYYYSNTKDYYAIDSVTLVNPDYTIYSDSLRYNTGSDISYFYGPTDIISDSNFIYCEYGWYNTKENKTRVSKNSYILNQEKKLNGDTIYYDRNIGFGEAFSNIAMLDTSAKMLITGGYANYYERPDRIYVTKRALLTKYGDGDSLFIHADTLRMRTVFDTLWVESVRLVDSVYKDTLVYSVPNEADLYSEIDSSNIDSLKLSLNDTLSLVNSFKISEFIHLGDLYRIFNPEIESVNEVDNSIISNDSLRVSDFISPELPLDLSTQIKVDTIRIPIIDTVKIVTAYYHTQIFKKDIQTRCDSLTYSDKDSIIRLYGNPILWSDEQQITADYIEILTENNNPSELFLDQSAFIAIKDDSIRYNQIEGVTMRGFFNDNNEMYKLWVEKDAKSVFFPREDQTEVQKKDSIKGDLVGANITESINMMIWFIDNQPYKITMYSAPTGVLNPVEYKPASEYALDGFSWKEALRPKQLEDIFIWKEELKEEVKVEDKKNNSSRKKRKKK